MEKINYKDFVKISKNYLNNSQFTCGFAVERNFDSKVLLSSPHGVVQTRLGKSKGAEIGSARLALVLRNSSYKDEIVYLTKQYGIKYLIDFHGLPSNAKCDINLGINFGNNIKNNVTLYDTLIDKLEKGGFKVNIDNPFCGRYPSISATFAQDFNLWSIQFEVNCAITNDPENINKLNRLIHILKEFIELCEVQ